MAAGSLFQRLLGAAKQVATPALTSGGLTAGAALLTGSSIPAALVYGAADTAASGGSLALLRKLRPGSYKTTSLKNLETGEVTTTPQTSRLELPVNIAASIGTGTLVSSVLEGGNPQTQQIAQQLEQRSAVNQLPLEQELANLSPGTQYQISTTEFEQLLNNATRQQNYANYLSPYDQQLLAEALHPVY